MPFPVKLTARTSQRETALTTKQPNKHSCCVECGGDLPVVRKSIMKYCSRLCAIDYRRKHLDLYKNEGTWRTQDKAHYLSHLRHKKNGSRKTLSVNFLVRLWEKQNGLCAITGQTMTHIGNQGRVGTNASIDQIKPQGGYTEDNVQLVTCDANRIKGSLSMGELFDLCQDILRNRKGKLGSKVRPLSRKANRKDQPKRSGKDD